MSRIEYSHGWIGYLLKYLGGVTAVLVSVLFAALFALTFTTGYLAEQSLMAFAAALVFPAMAILTGRGAWFLFRYRRSLTSRIVFEGDRIQVQAARQGGQNAPFRPINRIIYFRALKLFLIEAHGHPSARFLIMNNALSVTGDFDRLRDHLLTQRAVEYRLL